VTKTITEMGSFDYSVRLDFSMFWPASIEDVLLKLLRSRTACISPTTIHGITTILPQTAYTVTHSLA